MRRIAFIGQYGLVHYGLFVSQCKPTRRIGNVTRTSPEQSELDYLILAPIVAAHKRPSNAKVHL